MLAEPASWKLKFISVPKKAAIPTSAPDDQPDADQQLADRDDLGEPGVGLVVEQVAQEVLEPGVGARRGRRSPFRHRGRPLQVAFEGGAALHPGVVADLVLAGGEPLLADEEADRHPDDGEEGVAQQELPGDRVVDLAGRRRVVRGVDLDPASREPSRLVDAGGDDEAEEEVGPEVGGRVLVVIPERAAEEAVGEGPAQRDVECRRGGGECVRPVPGHLTPPVCGGRDVPCVAALQ